MFLCADEAGLRSCCVNTILCVMTHLSTPLVLASGRRGGEF